MIAPEPREPTTAPTPLGILLRHNLLASAFVFALLESWRPCYFLTDDNLDGGFPFFCEMGNRLWHGQSPFVSDHLFGGGYDLLRDPCFFAWHPLYLLTSLLGITPWRYVMIDVDAFVMLMLATSGFIVLASHLRRELELRIGDGWIMFYALSFNYSMIVLTSGASWADFLGNHSALPWLALGILQRDARRGIGLVLLFSLHQLLGGHLSPTVSSSVFLSLFACGMSVARKSGQPIVNWLAGYALAVIVISPLLLHVIGGFAASARSQGITLEDMQNYSIPASAFPTSLLLGMALWIVHGWSHPDMIYVSAMGSCAAAWCILPAMVSWARWRGIEVVTLALTFFIALLVCRPTWVSEIMMHLPLFRSMRWPFRELIQFQFFLHLFLVLRPPGLAPTARGLFAAIGAVVMVIPLLLYGMPPTFNPMSLDRHLIMSGGFDRYWAHVRPLLQPGDKIAVLIPLKLYEADRFGERYSLLGTYNYAQIAGVVNAWGYSPTVPRDQTYTKTYAYYPFGAYNSNPTGDPNEGPDQKAPLMAERPGLKFITLESLHPLKITLSSRDGPTIDLTPFVPPELQR